MIYDIRCPKCGKELAPHAGDWQDAPWLCSDCHRGFFSCELSPRARENYRPHHHDWGLDIGATFSLKAERAAELQRARIRGTSALPEHLGLLSDEELDHLSRYWTLHEDFANRLEAQRNARKAVKKRGAEVD